MGEKYRIIIEGTLAQVSKAITEMGQTYPHEGFSFEKVEVKTGAKIRVE